MNKKITPGELESLIGLLEKVSSDVEEKEKRLRSISFNTFVNIMLFFLLLLMSLAHHFESRVQEGGTDHGLIYVLLFAISTFILLFNQLRFFVEKMWLTDAIRYDRLMLDRLQDVFNLHRDEVEEELGIIGKAILNMRLKRVNFKT